MATWPCSAYAVWKNNIERNQRKCPLCTSDIEDEFYFILICPAYIDLRKTYIHKYFHTRPSMYKLTKEIWKGSKCVSRGGDGGPDPPGKSQVIWVSIGNKQLDPWKKLDPPLENVGPPLEPWKTDRSLWNWPFDFCKISWGLKKQTKKNVFFCQTDLDPHWRHFLDPYMGSIDQLHGQAHETLVIIKYKYAFSHS